jgi:ADP-ribose pyrophosphatase
MAGEAKMPEELKPWRTLQRKMVLDHSPWMRVYADDVELPDGRVIEGYLRLESPGYAMIVPVDTDQRIAMIRSYKRGVDAIDMQPPAGIIEPGEDPLATAKRELIEEIGCSASDWIALGTYVLGGNFFGGLAHLYLALGCRKIAEPNPDDLEEQEVVWLSKDQAIHRWRSAEFHQLSTAAILGLAFSYLDSHTPHGSEASVAQTEPDP